MYFVISANAAPVNAINGKNQETSPLIYGASAEPVGGYALKCLKWCNVGGFYSELLETRLRIVGNFSARLGSKMAKMAQPRRILS